MPLWKKWLLALLLGGITFVVTFASTVFSTATEATAIEYGVSAEVTTLGTSLFVLGFVFGPVVWGPMSELYGRKTPLLIGYGIFVVFQIPVAVAQNLATVIVCRFLGGVGAAAPPSIVGGYLADFFDPLRRGLAVAIFTTCNFLGPIVGPIIGGFVTSSHHLGWRWNTWITMILGAGFGTAGLVLLPETYAPVLLQRKARRIRYETRNWAIHAKLGESPVDWKAIVVKYLGRPFIMLVQEPILFLMTLYTSFIYGFIYLLFEAYPVSFYNQRGYSLGVSALPFIAIGIGVIAGSSYIYYVTQTRMKRSFEHHGKMVPEDRLRPMIVGAVLLPIGCFWFAWTSSPHITPWPQIIAGVPLGAGLQILLLQGLAYIIDVYLIHANSAMSANTIVRSCFGAGFPMFTTAMYQRLGVNWATSLLGFLAILFLPVPVLFYLFGARIRRRSRLSWLFFQALTTLLLLIRIISFMVGRRKATVATKWDMICHC
ncbi:hypothetical protein T310_1475 [Rasamsonia emersonii CBS 393.64]|uniref:Major facilitator superfamily (MFS) profile domain-containing protein n=1 Tax=Rasamsonia emersonii (strain ATCC 16479 / CBS 393.64 / IMI 116815) TaxID=1408163 RepID=A0A0F4Z2X6_RASE3|nr:hypothetical protein T310_1475 [Rasamsonia emersonii CBS 393.64]KKA24446.1 hypothetical protein T310_1475 [Rasamsonia emersonii CBS 393.64]